MEMEAAIKTYQIPSSEGEEGHLIIDSQEKPAEAE